MNIYINAIRGKQTDEFGCYNFLTVTYVTGLACLVKNNKFYSKCCQKYVSCFCVV